MIAGLWLPAFNNGSLGSTSLLPVAISVTNGVEQNAVTGWRVILT